MAQADLTTRPSSRSRQAAMRTAVAGGHPLPISRSSSWMSICEIARKVASRRSYPSATSRSVRQRKTVGSSSRLRRSLPRVLSSSTTQPPLSKRLERIARAKTVPAASARLAPVTSSSTSPRLAWILGVPPSRTCSCQPAKWSSSSRNEPRWACRPGSLPCTKPQALACVRPVWRLSLRGGACGARSGLAPNQGRRGGRRSRRRETSSPSGGRPPTSCGR